MLKMKINYSYKWGKSQIWENLAKISIAYCIPKTEL